MSSPASYMREYMKEWRARNRERWLCMHRAHEAVAKAIKKGVLSRPDVCDRCGRECVPDAHHADYEKPLEVEWLCKPCHAEA